MVIVYRREGGLTAADRAKVARDVVRLNRLRYPQLQRSARGSRLPRRPPRPPTAAPCW